MASRCVSGGVARHGLSRRRGVPGPGAPRAAAEGSGSGGPPALDCTTVWRASLELDAELAPVAVKVRFVVEEGYQPPQGVVEVVEDELGVLTGNTTRWRLAEDEDDDSGNPLDGGGLWIWGLFAEPLYPYLLVEFEHHALNLPGGRVLEGGLVQAKIPHEREKRRAKVGLAEATDGVTLEPGELRRRKVERVAADRIGLSQASVSTWEPCGAASIVPLAVDA